MLRPISNRPASRSSSDRKKGRMNALSVDLPDPVEFLDPSHP
jgi:hypothetical protein